MRIRTAEPTEPTAEKTPLGNAYCRGAIALALFFLLLLTFFLPFFVIITVRRMVVLAPKNVQLAILVDARLQRCNADGVFFAYCIFERI
jgi:hypothetical protein